MSQEICHIWIGQLGPATPDDFFSDRYNEDKTRDLFTVTQDTSGMDYDLVEISWLDEMKDVRSFVDGHSYSASYLDQVVTMTATLGVSKINVFIVASQSEFRKPCSVSTDRYQLWYLGEFKCEG